MTTRSEREANDANGRLTATLERLLRDPSNLRCADCKTYEARWAAWNLGIFICIRCSGFHRSLGTHVSKVKSVDLDAWTPEQVAIMEQAGNHVANSYFEYSLPRDFVPLEANMEEFIKAKYVHKKYVPPHNLSFHNQPGHGSGQRRIASGDKSAFPPYMHTSESPAIQYSAAAGVLPYHGPATHVAPTKMRLPSIRLVQSNLPSPSAAPPSAGNYAAPSSMAGPPHAVSSCPRGSISAQMPRHAPQASPSLLAAPSVGTRYMQQPGAYESTMDPQALPQHSSGADFLFLQPVSAGGSAVLPRPRPHRRFSEVEYPFEAHGMMPSQRPNGHVVPPLQPAAPGPDSFMAMPACDAQEMPIAQAPPSQPPKPPVPSSYDYDMELKQISTATRSISLGSSATPTSAVPSYVRANYPRPSVRESPYYQQHTPGPG